MDWDVIAPLIMGVTVTLSIAGVLIIRPLTKRLGDLIEATARDKRVKLKDHEIIRLTEVVGRLTERLERLEERQDFTEGILTSLDRPGEARSRLGEPPAR
jgi:hypothetical protein